MNIEDVKEAMANIRKHLDDIMYEVQALDKEEVVVKLSILTATEKQGMQGTSNIGLNGMNLTVTGTKRIEL